MGKPMNDSSVKGPSKFYVYGIASVGALGGFLFGYGLNLTGSAMIFMKDQFHLSDPQIGFAMASAIIGCMLGPIIGGFLSDRVGRKKSLFIAAVLFIVGSVGTAAPQTIEVFNIFRIIGGLGIGLSSVVSPMYIAEIAPARIRGRLVLLYQLAIGVGALCAVLVAYALSFHHAWRWMFGSGLFPSILFFGLLFFVPCSPRWLAQKKRTDEALDILIRVNGPQIAQKELASIKASLTEDKGRFFELFQPGLRRALLIALVLAVMANWTGFTLVGFYMPLLFQKSGFGEPDKAILLTAFIYSVNILLTLLCVWLVDRVGRRPLYLLSAAGMIVATFMMGLVFHMSLTGLWVVVAVLLMLWPHALGLGALPWLMIAELFPNRVRAKGAALATVAVWIAGFTGTQFFPMLNAVFEQHFRTSAGTFWIFTGLNVFLFIFALNQLPETKGKELEEIAEFWS